MDEKIYIVPRAAQPGEAAIPYACTKCRRTETIDPTHPSYDEFNTLPEPRKAVCSSCVIRNA